MNDSSYNPDHLKPLISVSAPDPRSEFFVIFDSKIGKFRPKNFADHHEAIAHYSLSSSVPKKVITHFETGKNIYLYAWFVYRFYPVADLHVRTTLELALKERIYNGNVREASKPVKKMRGLKDYILYAIKQGWVLNEGFKIWQKRAHDYAEYQASMELIHEMEQTGEADAMLDQTRVEKIYQENNWDFLSAFAASIPNIRNEYAHGSSMLHNSVLGTFELVAEFINQLWPEAGDQDEN